jgi:phosphoribosylaminoimidazole-succinocarboxamide synthase
MSSPSPTVITKTSLASHLPLLATGKVREIYSLPSSTTTSQEEHLLFVATDRISAYDVILSTGIPLKGSLLTRISSFWFSHLSSQLPHLRTHFISLGLPKDVATALEKKSPGLIQSEGLNERSCVVQKLHVLPVESIVRGYITGSAWASYQKTGQVNGETLPKDLQESQKLDKPIWTPSTKAEQGAHDENISREAARELLGKDVAAHLEELSLEIYKTAASYAESRGIILADTKFEFALDGEQLVLVDEVLTPDSSRFWRADDYAVGRGQKSLDKQFLRDWLTKEGLKGKEGVGLPAEVLAGTRKCYEEAFAMLTGAK